MDTAQLMGTIFCRYYLPDIIRVHEINFVPLSGIFCSLFDKSVAFSYEQCHTSPLIVCSTLQCWNLAWVPTKSLKLALLILIY
jgi:hypothetical protein